MKSIIAVFTVLASIPTHAAVSLNSHDIGEVLILPYYTVNNNLSSLVSVTNTSATQSKAVKILFKEGQNGYSVGGINVYLAPNDVWTLAMAKVGEDTVVFSQDLSCSPGFEGSFALSDESTSPIADANDINLPEGHIEIYEMGSMDPSFGFGQAVTFTDGQVNDCAQIAENWQQAGVWSTDDANSQLMPATGELTAALNLVDVSNGMNYSIGATAFVDFFIDDEIIHSAPDNYTQPALSDSNPTSLLLHNGDAIETLWPTGFEAISALLFKNKLMLDYSYQFSLNSSTEVVFSFPTKFHHLKNNLQLEPFLGQDTNGSFKYCELFSSEIYDRETNDVFNISGGATPRPPFFCGSTSSILIGRSIDQNPEYYSILGAENIYSQYMYDDHAGYFNVELSQATTRGQDMMGQNISYHGLPVIAHYLSRYTNANAQPGLLAQYGSAFKTQNKIKITSAN